MIIRFWHWKPLPTDIRGTFELPAWPYYHSDTGPMPDELIKWCQDLGIVRLEVQGKTCKLLCPVTPDCPMHVDGEWPNKWRKPWKCYHSFGIFDSKTLVVKAWNPNHPAFTLRVASRGAPDNYCWLSWNDRLVVRAMDSTGVQS